MALTTRFLSFQDRTRRRAQASKGPRLKASFRPRLECLEERQLLAYTGPKEYAIAYNPTWPNWNSKTAVQLNDSDFFNVSFAGLWGTGTNGRGRNDLGTISAAGFNVMRPYNWGPSRQGTDGLLDAHLPFLNDAQRLGLKVIVPVSDYFLGNDQFSWNGHNPDANYSFNSAPLDIRKDLEQFVASITKNGKLDPAVQSISIGNELDLGIDKDPGMTSKLERAMWWVVNLQSVLSQKFGAAVPHQFLTIPISNADQGNAWQAGTSTGSNSAATLNDIDLKAHPAWGTNIFAGLTIKIVAGTGSGETNTVVSNTSTSVTVATHWTTVPDRTSVYQISNPNPVSWFQVFDHGAVAGERVPTGTVPDGPAGRFTANVKGLGSFSWYNTWFFNSVNMFQQGDQLKNTLVQYDTGTPSGPTWSQMWPGEKLSVPLFVTELGSSRFDTTQAAQANVVANDQAQVVENVLKTSTNIMGYTIFEFNDEPNKNNITNGPLSEQFFGVTMYNPDQNKFRQGTLLFNLATGETKWAGGTMPNYVYPVFSLIPVEANGTTLLAMLKLIFNEVK